MWPSSKQNILDKDEYARSLKTLSLTNELVAGVEWELEERLPFFEAEQHWMQSDTYNEILTGTKKQISVEQLGKDP